MINTVLIFLVLLGLSGLFSAIEIAFFSLSHGRARTMVRQNLYAARLVERLKQRPRHLLVTILIGNNLVNVAAAAIATGLAISLFGSEGVGIATGVVTLLVLVFGEIFPKAFAQNNPEKVSRYTAPFVYAFHILFAPLSWILERFLDLSLSDKRSKLSATSKVTEEEIRSLFQIGYEKGLIESHEKEFAERLFRFNDEPVSSVTRSLESAAALNGDLSVGESVKPALFSDYSRFPVFKGELSNIVGVVHIKDLMKENDSAEQRGKALSLIAREPLFVRLDEELDDAFRLMVRKQNHFALVKDASGAIAGYVTLEDIIEELVGEIYDESDAREEDFRKN